MSNEDQIEQLMEQVQVFASAWALVGTRFDRGDAIDHAEELREELREMLVAALKDKS